MTSKVDEYIDAIDDPAERLITRALYVDHQVKRGALWDSIGIDTSDMSEDENRIFFLESCIRGDLNFNERRRKLIEESALNFDGVLHTYEIQLRQLSPKQRCWANEYMHIMITEFKINRYAARRWAIESLYILILSNSTHAGCLPNPDSKCEGDVIKELKRQHAPKEK